MCELFQPTSGSFLECRKMDKFAGSEPRIFISFCLGNESSSHSAPESGNVVDSTATKPDNSEQAEISSDDSIEVIEITLSSPELVDSAPSSPCKGVVKLEPENLRQNHWYRRQLTLVLPSVVAIRIRV